MDDPMAFSINSADWHFIGDDATLVHSATQTALTTDIVDVVPIATSANLAAEQSAATAVAVAEGAGGGYSVLAASALAGVVGLSMGALLMRRWHRQQEAAQKVAAPQPPATLGPAPAPSPEPPLSALPLVVSAERAAIASLAEVAPVPRSMVEIPQLAVPVVPVNQGVMAMVTPREISTQFATAQKAAPVATSSTVFSKQGAMLPSDPPHPFLLETEVTPSLVIAEAPQSLSLPASPPVLPLPQKLASPPLPLPAIRPASTVSPVSETVASPRPSAASALATQQYSHTQLQEQNKLPATVAAYAIVGIGFLTVVSSAAMGRYLLRNTRATVARVTVTALPTQKQPPLLQADQSGVMVSQPTAVHVHAAATIAAPALAPATPTLPLGFPVGSTLDTLAPMASTAVDLKKTSAIDLRKTSAIINRISPGHVANWTQPAVPVPAKAARRLGALMPFSDPNVDHDFNILCQARPGRFAIRGDQAPVVIIDGRVRLALKSESASRVFRILPPR